MADDIEALDDLIVRVRRARDRGAQWVVDHVAADGEPVGANKRNGWGRVPWALAVCGRADVGSAVLGWAERNALADDGFFRDGSTGGGARLGSYPLAHFALGAWLLDRYDLALRCMGALRKIQDPATGGIAIDFPGGSKDQRFDLLCTAQVGLSAVVTGQHDVAENVYRWIRDLVALQPEPNAKLYNMRDGAALLTDPPPPYAWAAITDFSKPRQTYYMPGMSAVFLAGYGLQHNDGEALRLGHRLLQLNINGTPAQFDDPQQVQICKFGWGAAALQCADPSVDYAPWLMRMGEWFIARQSPDGAWTPSSFATPEPDDIDRLIKTAEHAMEVNALLSALATMRARLAA